jgi:hypothetical protein
VCCAGVLRHQAALLDCAHRAAGAQAQYLSQFLETVRAQGVTGVSGWCVLDTLVSGFRARDGDGWNA